LKGTLLKAGIGNPKTISCCQPQLVENSAFEENTLHTRDCSKKGSDSVPIGGVPAPVPTAPQLGTAALLGTLSGHRRTLPLPEPRGQTRSRDSALQLSAAHFEETTLRNEVISMNPSLPICALPVLPKQAQLHLGYGQPDK